MMKFGANVTQTALKGFNLAQAGNYDHVLNLKYTCRALPSCLNFIKIEWVMTSLMLFPNNCPYIIFYLTYKLRTWNKYTAT